MRDGAIAVPTSPAQGSNERPHGARSDRTGDVRAANIQRAELTDLSSPLGIGGAVRLQVVTASGVPVVGATVLYVPLGADILEIGRQFKAHGRDMEATLQAHGREATTDEAGIVEVHVKPKSEVCARLGSDYGELYLYGYGDSSAETPRIVLINDVTLEVSVEDEDGRPVSGRLVHVAGTFLSRMSGMTPVSEAFGPSDSAGKVVVRHLLYKLDVCGDVFDGELQVYSRRQCNEWTRPVTIAAQKVSHTALHGVVKARLVEPVGGVLEVRALDADGNPVRVSVSLQDEDGVMWMMHPPARGKVSVFVGVPLGRRWRAVARYAGQDHGLEVVGPRASGQRVSVDLSMPIRRWEFTGRLVRADGSPIASRAVWPNSEAVNLFLGWRDGSLHNVKSDESGRLAFRMWLPASVRSLPGLTVNMSLGNSRSRAFRIDRLLTVADSDLGDLVSSQMGEDCLLATFAFSCGGKPLSDASVELCQSSADATEGVEVDARQERRGPVLEFWGVAPLDGHLTATCRHVDCLEKEVVLSLGERVAVKLDRSASLLVRMDCGELPVDGVSAVLVSLEDPDLHDRELIDPEQQACGWHSMLPGRYRLRVFVHQSLVHDEAEIVLQEGDNVWPSSSTRLDLRSRVRGVYVLARSATTGEQVGIEGMLVPRNSMALPADRTPVSVWFPRPDTASDLLVSAWGYVPMRVEFSAANLFPLLQPLTVLRVLQPKNPIDVIRARLLFDPLIDPLLLTFDEQCRHASEFEIQVWDDGRFQEDFIPGTKLELTAMREGVPGTPVQVVIGALPVQMLKM